MEQEQIRDLLKKKEEGKINAYMAKTVKRKEKYQDLTTLLQAWVHCLLHHKNLYPSYAFVERDILGITVPVASAVALKEYLDTFFMKLEPHLPYLNHLQILILSSSEQIIEIHTLHIDNLEVIKHFDEEESQMCEMGNSTQRDIEVKSFLYEIDKKLKEGFVKTEEEVTFKLRVSCSLQQQNEKREDMIVQDWIKRDKCQNQGTIKTSLKLNELNLIYETSK